VLEKKLIIFDVDGTLTESKQTMTVEMAVAVTSLLEICEVAFISGCGYKQMGEQLLDSMIWHNRNLPFFHNLHLLPTSGTQMYDYARREEGFYKVYDNELSLREKVEIYNVWDFCAGVTSRYGEIAEDRGSQVTFSMCGQKAPLEVKKRYDPTGEKRLEIAEGMRERLSGFEIRVGGTTSIDVTKKGLDKKYGVLNLLSETGYTPEECLFFGDTLYEGGDDAPVKEAGVECIQVSGPEDTLKYISELI